MNTSEIKIDLFRKIDSLKDSRLKEVYVMLVNFINSKNENDEWESLTKEQQTAINVGIEQLNNGEGRKHNDVMSDFRNKFINAFAFYGNIYETVRALFYSSNSA